MPLNSEILGLPIPDAGPVFAMALVIHILSGLTAVIAGALAATARKRPGRHPRTGRVYLWALGGVFATAMIWRSSAGTKTPTYSPSPWSRLASACTATAPADATAPGGQPTTPSAWAAPILPCSPFYVDNGPFPPLWDRLPHITYWLLPSLVGIPLVWLALRRFQHQPACLVPTGFQGRDGQAHTMP
jgi:hypothetical protein